MSIRTCTQTFSLPFHVFCFPPSSAVVSIEHIASFKRMKALTSDLPAIVAALRASDKLVVDEEGKMVRRTNALPEKAENAHRIIYAVASHIICKTQSRSVGH